VLAEVDGERARVVLDRGDVVDHLADAGLHEGVERSTLDVDQVRNVEDTSGSGLLEMREVAALALRTGLGRGHGASLLEMDGVRRMHVAGGRRATAHTIRKTKRHAPPFRGGAFGRAEGSPPAHGPPPKPPNRSRKV
jgi:hypothetical protein